MTNERCASVMGFQAGFFFGIALTGFMLWLVSCGGRLIPPLQKDAGVLEIEADASVPPSPVCTTWNTCNPPDATTGSAGGGGCNGPGCSGNGTGGTPGPGSGGQGLM